MEAEKSRISQENKITKNEQIADITLEEIRQQIAENPDDADLYYIRAELYFQQNDLGKAVNDYKKVLDLNPENYKASAKIDFIRTILRYQNSDIYANPNTNLDPWLE